MKLSRQNPEHPLVSPQRKDAEGFWLCRWKPCSKRISQEKRPRSWCSRTCDDEASVRMWPTIAASRVHRRDQGICALCKTDTRAIRDELRELKRAFEVCPQELTARERMQKRDAYYLRLHYYSKLGFPMTRMKAGHELCDVDHVIPVAEGGGGCGLEGLRTLCCPCHESATKKLTDRLTEARRKAKDAGLVARKAE